LNIKKKLLATANIKKMTLIFGQIDLDCIKLYCKKL